MSAQPSTEGFHHALNMVSVEQRPAAEKALAWFGLDLWLTGGEKLSPELSQRLVWLISALTWLPWEAERIRGDLDLRKVLEVMRRTLKDQAPSAR